MKYIIYDTLPLILRLLRRFAPRNDRVFYKLLFTLFLNYHYRHSHCEERSDEAIPNYIVSYSKIKGCE